MIETLDETLRAQAVEWAQEKLGSDWFDSQQITEMLEESIREDHHLEGIHHVDWSLGCCQGDGVAFEGHIDLGVLREHQPELDGMMRECEALAALLGCEFDLVINRCQVRHRGRYYNKNSMELEFEWDYGDCDGYRRSDPLDARIEGVRDWLEGYIERAASALAKIGYAEIDYRTTAEYAAEHLEGNPDLLAVFLAEHEEFPVGC